MPSVLLAIALPGVEITACERIGKKAQFLNQVRRELSLTNFKVFASDVREICDEFDVITCRAVATIDEILVLTNHVAKDGQKYVLPKGRDYKSEVENAKLAGHKFDFSVAKSIVEDDSFILDMAVFKK